MRRVAPVGPAVAVPDGTELVPGEPFEVVVAVAVELDVMVEELAVPWRH